MFTFELIVDDGWLLTGKTWKSQGKVKSEKSMYGLAVSPLDEVEILGHLGL